MPADQRTTPWLLALLRQFRPRPGMYLGDTRLNSLSCYIHGVFFGLEQAGIEGTAEERFLRAFGDWLGLQVESKNGDCWFYLTLFPESSGDVSEFYEKLDLFIEHSGYPGGLERLSDLHAWQREAAKGD